MSVLLEKVNHPSDIKDLSNEDLIKLSKEIRDFLLYNLSKTGGHLGPNLGVVELTLALHKVFNAPHDKIVWDVGHQSYIHKILTGRKEFFSKLRQQGGISGFTKRLESVYDVFGAGHSSTSISAALGVAVANQILGKTEDVIAVIGDASIVSGIAFEGLNHAGSLDLPNFTIVLNDNNKSILDSVGALNAYFSKLTSSYSYSYIREHSKTIIDSIPFGMGKLIKDLEKYLRNITNNGFFEALGFFYIGPIDGHNFDHLIPILNNIKYNKNKSKPVLLHVITQKGKGYLPAEEAKDNYHGIGKFCIESGKISDSKCTTSFSEVFGSTLTRLAIEDKKIVAITSGTLSGVGLSNFSKICEKQIFDVGIAEQHTVTFAAGLAVQGLKPFVCLYSTFAQRAYDQIVHDVCLQNLPVRFILDRTGFVGADGATHHGLLNYTMYLPLPNIVYMVPFTENELRGMLKIMQHLNFIPSFLSFARTSIVTEEEIKNYLNNSYLPTDFPKENLLISNEVNETHSTDLKLDGVTFGKGHILQRGKKIAIISMGVLLKEILKANVMLLQENIMVTIVNIRFLKPLDTKLLNDIISNHEILLTFEEGYGGGFFTHIYNYYQKNENKNRALKLKGYWTQDRYFEQATQEEQLKETNLDSLSIYNRVKQYI